MPQNRKISGKMKAASVIEGKNRNAREGFNLLYPVATVLARRAPVVLRQSTGAGSLLSIQLGNAAQDLSGIHC